MQVQKPCRNKAQVWAEYTQFKFVTLVLDLLAIPRETTGFALLVLNCTPVSLAVFSGSA